VVKGHVMMMMMMMVVVVAIIMLVMIDHHHGLACRFLVTHRLGYLLVPVLMVVVKYDLNKGRCAYYYY